MVTKFHVELETGPKYGGVEWDVKEPPYRPEFILTISGKPRDRLNCKNKEEWAKFAKKWWDIRERATTGITVKIPFIVTAVVPSSLPVSIPTGENLDSTQSRRLQVQPAHSATQR